MSIIEFIGFVFSFALFIFLMFLRATGGLRRKTQPQDRLGEKSQEEKLKDFLKALEGDMGEVIPAPPPVKKQAVRKPPPPPKVPVPQFKPLESIEKRFSGNTMVSSHYIDLAKATPYEVAIQTKPSRAHALLSQLKSKKDMVILNEIIGKPRAFRL